MKRNHVIATSVGLAATIVVIIVINRSFKPYETGPTVRSEFLEHLQNGETMTFRSFDGNWIGTDCDIDLHFTDNKHVVMVEYGYGVIMFHGTYRIDSNGVIAASFPKSIGNWPMMILGRDAKSLLLDTAGDSALFSDRRASAAESSGGINHWPFRPTTDTEITQRFMNK